MKCVLYVIFEIIEFDNKKMRITRISSVSGNGTLGLTPTNNDNYILLFVKYVNECDLINLYIKHSIKNPKVVDENELGHDYDEEL